MRDLLAFADVDRADHAAIAVLDGLALAVDHQLARRHRRRIEPGHGGPADQHHEEQISDDVAEPHVGAGIVDPLGRLAAAAAADSRRKMRGQGGWP